MIMYYFCATVNADEQVKFVHSELSFCVELAFILYKEQHIKVFVCDNETGELLLDLCDENSIITERAIAVMA